MIHLLTGDFGSGKTAALAAAIAADVAAGRRAYLLVPEQQTVTAERDMAELLPASAPLCFEVSNFSRLANTVFRMVGGLSYRYADAGTRTLIMWRTMSELLPLLHGERGESTPEIGRVRKMTAAMRELSALSLTPKQLENAATCLPEGSHLREKMADLALIGTLYHALLHERYDDVTDDLARLADVLTESDVLGGAHIYVDGFVSYTEQEYRVLRALARTSDITLTLTLPAAREENICFFETRDTAARLSRLASEVGVAFTRTDLGEDKRTAAPLLRDLLVNLFDETEKTDPVCRETPKNAPVSVVCAQDSFAASEYIASDIARRVMEEGAHYRDFAVIVRSTENYAGILDAAFENAAIPYFFSRRTDIDAYPAVKLIYTAYAVCLNGWRQSDVISYLKCGMSGFTPDEVDIFELYTTRWQLSGRRITDDTPWTMNPDGYQPTLTDRGAEIIACAERVRAGLCDQLTPLAESCGRRPLREHCRSVYELLTALGVEDALLARAEEARAAGNKAESEELSRLFSVLCGALDRLAEALPDVTLPAEAFLDLLKLMLGEVNMAQIPTSLDEVTVGAADLLRVGDVRQVYLLGVNEGEFPAPVSDAGVFTESDRRTLSALGLSVAPDHLLRASRELFCFARAFAAARDSVTLLYAERSLSGAPLTPAPELLRIVELSALPVIKVAALSPAERFFRAGTAYDYLGLLSGTPAGRALAAYFAEKSDLPLPLSERPLADPQCRLSPETADALYGGGISLTQSRIDRYVSCPFAYFCRYVLRLDPAKVIEFDYGDVGTLLHTVLERFFASLAEENIAVRDLSQEELYGRIEHIIEEYIDAICPSEQQKTPRLAHLIGGLRRAAGLVVRELCEELAQSAFTPAMLELDVGKEGGDAPGPLPFTLPDGTRVSLYGRIDRVDTWTKDGKTYLRVIDYKSGKKDFSLDDVARGLDLQLLIYLFSLWKSENPRFREKIAGADGEILPAGVLYTAARPAEKTYDAPPTREEAEKEAQRSICRSGLLLDDREVLCAMEQGLAGRFIPVKELKNGGFSKNSMRSLASLERMGSLLSEIDDTVCRIASGMRRGDAAARPLLSGKTYACQYCDMKAVCRSSRNE